MSENREREELYAELCKRGLPDYMHGGVMRYICEGVRPGDFLTAVLHHDLFESVGHADSNNLEALPAWVKFFYNVAPGRCHGSPERVQEWCKLGGLEGIRKRA
jgi:hypothetical protein